MTLCKGDRYARATLVLREPLAPPSTSKRQPIPFGKYLLLDRINIGGMAEVWRGKSFGHGGFERLVAIKRILPNIAEDAEFIAMFIDEAKITVQLTHANIAQIYELGHIANSYFIAMEYIAGKDLRAIFDRSRKRGEPAPIPLTCHVISKVCEGLDYAHRKKDGVGRDMNIVHRDVSPQNLLVSYEGEVKVIDFGIAKAAGKATRTQAGILKGKFGYMSPEQIRGLNLDRRSDVFAVGICLYELLTGERLFIGDSDFSVLEKVRKAEIAPPSTYNQRIPSELEQIVLKALARDTADRYQYASEVAEDLQKFLITSGSVFGRKDVAEYMKATFAEDVEREKLRQQEYAELKPPATAPGGQQTYVSVTAAPTVGADDGSAQTYIPPRPSSPAPAAAAVPPRRSPSLPRLTPVSLEVEVEEPEDHRQRTVLMDRTELMAHVGDLANEKPPPVPATSPEPPRAESTSTSISTGSPTVAEIPVRRNTSAWEAETGNEVAADGIYLSRRQVIALATVGAGMMVFLVVGWVLALRSGPSGFVYLNAPPGVSPEALAKARINVNGEEVNAAGKGLTWPVVTKVDGGRALVLVALPGYEPFRQELTVAEGQTVDLTPTVRRMAKTVSLTVVTEPATAEVRVDGELVKMYGTPGDYVGPIDEAGNHEVVVRAPGFRPYQRKLTSEQTRRAVRLTAKLKPYEYPAVINSSPPQAAIFIDGKPMGTTPNNVKILGGSVEIALQKKCFRPQRIPVQLPPQPEGIATFTAQLERLPNCK